MHLQYNSYTLSPFATSLSCGFWLLCHGRRMTDTSITTTPTASSSVTSTSISSQAPSQILQISLISAQDLSPISKSMRTYAVTWIKPSRKKSTRIDKKNHQNPTWNEKFTFRVDDELLMSEDTALTIEIYTISWFRSVLIGTVRVLISDLISPSSHTRFIALQVRHPSGYPQGILNMGVALLDNKKAGEKKVKSNENDEEVNKIQMWRSLSNGSGSVLYDGSMVNGSELCSDIGPSASIVAADIARKMQPAARPMNVKESNEKKKLMYGNVEAEETGSSILEEMTVEEAIAKGYRIDDDNDDESEVSNSSRNAREARLFKCFGNAYGIQFTIVCGSTNNKESNGKVNSSKTTKINKHSKSEPSSSSV